jgi:hypothetical protein
MHKELRFEVSGDFTNLYFDGEVEYDKVDVSFDHEFGREKREDIAVTGVDGRILFVDDEGDEIILVDIEKCCKKLEEQVVEQAYDELLTEL